MIGVYIGMAVIAYLLYHIASNQVKAARAFAEHLRRLHDDIKKLEGKP